MAGSPSEILRRGYTDSEVKNLYAFGLYLSRVGRINDARVVFECLTNIVPSYLSAWLGLCYAQLALENREMAQFAARHAYRIAPDLPLVNIFLICSLLASGDYSAAGTYLGEFNERLESGNIKDQRLVRLYRAQLSRYEKGIKSVVSEA